MEDHCSAKRRESFGSLIRRLAAVDDHRKGELIGELELRVEEPALLERRCELANCVEPCLSDGDRFRVREQLAELVKPLCLRRRRLVRIDAESREDLAVLVGDRERPSARLDAGTDGHDPAHASGERSFDEGRCRLLARVEMRVRVGHAAGAGVSMRGKIGDAATIPDRAGVRPYATSSQPILGGIAAERIEDSS